MRLQRLVISNVKILLEIIGRSHGLSGAIVYAVCKKAGQDITQADIAKAAGTTHVTIRKRFRELEGIL